MTKNEMLYLNNHIKLTVVCITAIYATVAIAVEAYPLPRSGFCPDGYRASGLYCVPKNNKTGAAIERDGFCPPGYRASGNYCIATNESSGKLILRDGFCPSGYRSSGKYCIEKNN